MSSPLRTLGATLAILGVLVLAVAAALVLLNAKPTSLALATTIAAYAGLGLLTIGLVSALAAPSSAEPPR